MKKRHEKHLVKTALSSMCILALSSLASCARNDVNEAQFSTIGGTDAKKTPSFVSLVMPAIENGKKPQCGGTIIDLAEGAIATAAHCVKNLNIKGLAIKVSPMSLAEFSKGAAIPVEAVHMHPDFNQNLENDIALLFVNPEKLKAAGGIAAALVRDGKAALEAGNIVSMGFGNSSTYGTAYAQKLLEVKVPVIPLSECRKAGEGDENELFAHLDERTLCAGTSKGGKDVCHGDSGGPAYLEKNGKRELVGLVSWGVGCGQANLPGVYTHIPAFLSWIAEEIEENRNAKSNAGAESVDSVFQKKCFGLLPQEDEQKNKSSSLRFSSLLMPTSPFKKMTGNQKEALLKTPLGNHDSCQVLAPEGTAHWDFRSNAANDKIIALSPTGEIYAAPAEARVEFAAQCKIGNEDLRFDLDGMNTSSLMLGEQILVSIPFEEDEKFAFEHLDYIEVSQCTIQGKGIAILRSKQVQDNNSMYKVVLKGYDVPGISTPILLFPVPKLPSLEIKIVEMGQNKRAIQLKNETPDQIFGIEFVCDKAFSININGKVVKPVKTDDNQWAHSFLDSAKEHSRLFPTDTLSYEFVADETLSPGKPITCTINNINKFKIEARP